MRAAARVIILAILPLALGSCAPGERIVEPVSVSATLPSLNTSRDGRIPVNALSIDAPTAGDVFPVSMYRLDIPGRDKRIKLRRDFSTSGDLAPVVRNALDAAFAIDESSPYSAKVRMVPSYTIYFDHPLDFTHEVNGKSALYFTLSKGGEVLAKKTRYSGLAKDEHSVMDTTFPPKEMLASLLQKSLMEAVKGIAADPELDGFRR